MGTTTEGQYVSSEMVTKKRPVKENEEKRLNWVLKDVWTGQARLGVFLGLFLTHQNLCVDSTQ